MQKSNRIICGTVQNPINSNSEEKWKTIWVIGGSSYLGGLNIKLVLKKEMTIELYVYGDVLHIIQFTRSVHFDGASPNIRSSQF